MTIGPKQTRIAMLALGALALAWEVVALACGESATISEFVWSVSENQLFVFACGMLAGHFFFRKRRCAWCGNDPFYRPLVKIDRFFGRES